jgi:hypothetical protein
MLELVLMLCLVFCSTRTCSAHLERPLENARWPGAKPSLEYYVQVGAGLFYQLPPPELLNQTAEAAQQEEEFHVGGMQAFEFRVTEAALATSRSLGAVRGYVVDCSSSAAASASATTAASASSASAASAVSAASALASARHQVEVEVLSYADDATGLSGTLSFHGLINYAATNTIAIVGGTGSFSGARGHVVITALEPRRLYHHALYFVLP